MTKPTKTVSHWQLHTLSATTEYLHRVRPDCKLDKGYILTGTVVDDPTGKWEPGFHFRSTLVLSYDREQGILETANTIYRLQDPQGDKFLGCDMGDGVAKITY